MNDPVVEEVRRIRAGIAARNGNDLRRIVGEARGREGSQGRHVVSRQHTHAGASDFIQRE